jgi:recombinational DNA repair ATPase RecF
MPVSIRAMFLRSITIRGFKSFADKTVLEFVPGVSVIVGPNGSGKSNLVDAISWAPAPRRARRSAWPRSSLSSTTAPAGSRCP